MPVVKKFYENEEKQREFAEWKVRKEGEKGRDP